MTEAEAIAALSRKGFTDIIMEYGDEVCIECERRGIFYRSATVTADQAAGRAAAVDWLTTH